MNTLTTTPTGGETAAAKKKASPMLSSGVKIGAMSSALFAAAAASSSDWHTLLREFGFPVALVIFFVWSSWTREERAERNAIEREQRIANRVSQLEAFNQTELLGINNACIQAVADNTAALTRLVQALEDRPCLCEGAGLLEKLDQVAVKIDSLAKATG